MTTTPLTPQQARAIECLMQCRTVTDAAKAANVSRRTLTSWLADAQFCAELSKATSRVMDATVRRLTQLSASAVNVLDDVMSDDDADYGPRLRAADIALSRLLALRELHDLAERISRLEARSR